MFDTPERHVLGTLRPEPRAIDERSGSGDAVLSIAESCAHARHRPDDFAPKSPRQSDWTDVGDDGGALAVRALGLLRRRRRGCRAWGLGHGGEVVQVVDQDAWAEPGAGSVDAGRSGLRFVS